MKKRGKLNQGKNEHDHMLIVEVLILFELVLIPFYLLSELYLKSRYGTSIMYYLTKAKFIHSINVILVSLIILSFFDLAIGTYWQASILHSIENVHPIVTLITSSLVGVLYIIIFYSLDQRSSYRLIKPMKVLSDNLMLFGEGQLNINIPNYEEYHTAHEINVAIDSLNHAIERITGVFHVLMINTKRTQKILDKIIEIYESYNEFLTAGQKTIEEESILLKNYLTEFTETKDALLEQLHQYVNFMGPLTNYLEEFKATSDETWITTLNAQIESINIEQSKGATFSVVASKMQDVYKDIQRVFENMSEVIEQSLRMSYTLERDFAQSINDLEKKSQTLLNPNTQISQLITQLIERQRLVLDRINEMKAFQVKMLTSTSWFKDQNLSTLKIEEEL